MRRGRDGVWLDTRGGYGYRWNHGVGYWGWSTFAREDGCQLTIGEGQGGGRGRGRVVGSLSSKNE